MNKLNSVEMMGPELSTDICAEFVIDDPGVPFVFTKVVVTGMQYTAGFWVKSLSTGSITLGGENFVTDSEKWRRCEVTFNGDDTNNVQMLFASGTYYIYHFQLEKGGKATAWTPAPEDGESELRKLEGTISEIKLDQESITLQVKNIAVGGRNFLLGTGFEKKITGENKENQVVKAYNTSTFFQSNKPAAGVDMVLSFDWVSTNASGAFIPQWGGGTHYALVNQPVVTLPNGNGSGHYEHKFKMNNDMLKAPLSSIDIRLDKTSGSLVVSNMKLETGTIPTEWSLAPEDPASEVIAGSSVVINEDEVNITTPHFEVNTNGAEFNIPVAGEDGDNMVSIDKDGLTAKKINCPEVAKMSEGGIYTVGGGGDFPNLQAACDSISDTILKDNIYFKMVDSYDPGANINGVSGKGNIFISPINIANVYNDAGWTQTSATVSEYGKNGIRVVASSNGTYRYATLNLGCIGVIGLIGQTITIEAQMGSPGDLPRGYPSIVAECGDTSFGWATRTESDDGRDFITVRTTCKVPEYASPWHELKLHFRVSGSTSVEAGAAVAFVNTKVEIGNTVSSKNSGQTSVTVKNINVDGCTARVQLHELAFPTESGTAVKAYDSTVSMSKCTIKTSNGLMMWGGWGAMHNCYGYCTSCIAYAMGGATIELRGYVPGWPETVASIDSMLQGNVWKNKILNGNADAPGGEDPETKTTATLKASATGTYSGTAWWTSDAGIRQGYTTANGKLRGGIWFDLPDGATSISKATLTLTRVEGYGKGGNVKVRIYATSAASKSGDPAASNKISSDFREMSIAPGSTKTVDVTDLMKHENDTSRGFVIYSGDSSAMSGKTYSDNFARFAGTGNKNNIPVLTITY